MFKLADPNQSYPRIVQVRVPSAKGMDTMSFYR